MDAAGRIQKRPNLSSPALARKRAALPAVANKIRALDFNIAKKKRDAMLIDIGPNEDFAIAIVETNCQFVCESPRHSSQT